MKFIIFILSFSIFFTSAAFASPTVELWGHVDCDPCVKIKNELLKKGIKVKSHNLRNPQVESYYYRNFGKGKIPVVRVLGQVRRGIGASEVIRMIDNGGATNIKTDFSTKGQLECVGKKDKLSIDTYYEKFNSSLKSKKDRLLERSADIDFAIDHCFGTKGWLKCQESSFPYIEMVKVKENVYEIITTSGKSLRIESEGCKLFEYR